MKRAPILLVLLLSGCMIRGAGVIPAIIGTAIVTAAIVSAVGPPPPRIVYVEPRAGYVYQRGYWTRDGDGWVWVDGQWESERPGYVWVSHHWDEQPDGTWRLIPGHWAREDAP